MSLKQHGSGALDSKGRSVGYRGKCGLMVLLGAVCTAMPPEAVALQQGQDAMQQASATKAGPAPQDPALHKRSAAQPDATPVPVVATGHSDLPPEAEGDYPWDKLGGVIDLYFEDGKLHGYMTEHMDPDRHAAPATYDFATTHVDGHAVEWTTRVVHATSYSFTGHLERGLVASPTLPGYYLLTGTLTEHGGDADSLARTVSLKREPGAP